jgi:hypothetical protein
VSAAGLSALVAAPHEFLSAVRDTRSLWRLNAEQRELAPAATAGVDAMDSCERGV